MAATATAVYRVRVGGSDLNGGGFDLTVAGGVASNDLSQTTAYVYSSSTGVYTGSASAPFVFSDTNAAIVFSAAHVGNSIWINSATTAGSGFTKGAYFITSYNSANNTVTLDRAVSGANNSTGISWRLGGAWATPFNNFGLPQNNTTYVVPGTTLYIRGNGTDSITASTTPTYIQPSWSAYNVNGIFGNGYAASNVGYINILAENGRPLIAVSGNILASAYWKFQGLAFRDICTTAATAIVQTADYGSSTFIDCVFDQNGYDNYFVWGNNVLVDCEIFSSYVGNNGTNLRGTLRNCSAIHGVNTGGFTMTVINCNIHDTVAQGINTGLSSLTVINSIVSNCAKEAIALVYGSNTPRGIAAVLSGNTIVAPSTGSLNLGLGGVYLPSPAWLANAIIVGNIVANYNAAGQAAISVAGGSSLAASDALTMLISSNTFSNNTTNFSGIDSTYANAITGNPTVAAPIFTDPTVENYTPSSALAGLGFGLPNQNRRASMSVPVTYAYPGAIQPAAPAATYVINKITTIYLPGDDDAAPL